MLKAPLDLRGDGMWEKITLSNQTLKYRRDSVVQFRVRDVTGALMGGECVLDLHRVAAAVCCTEVGIKMSQYFDYNRTETKIQVCLSPLHMLF